MHTWKLLSILALISAFDIQTMAAPTPGLEASGLTHKVLSGPDDDGDLKISIKVTVLNTTEAEIDAAVVARAVDKEDFEVFDVRLTGKVKAGKIRVLTDTQFITEKLYKSIARWEIED